LKYSGTVGGTVSGCTINHGILVSTTSTVDFTGNTINSSNDYPVKAWADNVHSLVNGNTYNNLDAGSYLEVNSGNLTKDATWTAAIALVIKSHLTVKGTDGDDSITTLTIEPGAKIKLDGRRKIDIGGSSGDPGELIAQGSADNMILITSNDAAPEPAAWYGITFAATASQSSRLDHCVIEYGGYGGRNIYLNNRSVNITNSIIRNNSDVALYVAGANCNGVIIQCNTFENNSTGMYVTGAVPVIENNNFINNSYCGLRSYGTSIIAENNWWNNAAGPNQAGDKTMGDVDADPWSTELNQCQSEGSNQPPFEPTSPAPEDDAVNVPSLSPITLTWSGGDPDANDAVVYDIYLGDTAGTMTLDAQDVVGASHVISEPIRGITYYWQVIARDDRQAESTGPIWRFTTAGDPADLVISAVEIDPPGNLQSGQNTTLMITVQNIGNGPVWTSFTVDAKVGGTSIGTPVVDEIMLAGQSVVISLPWTYDGGDPMLDIFADRQNTVVETNRQNNQFTALLSAVADLTAPAMITTMPANDAHLPQVSNVTITLADSQSAVDDAAVISSFSITDSSRQNVPGQLAEANDTFTFTPTSTPLVDDTYTVSLTGIDEHGNSQSYSFGFTVDSQPPALPVITGGTVTSGTIQVRPVQNTSNQFVVELSGTREADSSVWLDGIEQVNIGSEPWSIQISLHEGDNALEVWLKDRAGNQGPSAWVDINVSTESTIFFEYDASGRVKRIDTTP
jgi:hypothetical protein